MNPNRGAGVAVQDQAALREAVSAAVEAMVKSLRHGEREYSRGLIEAGGHAHAVVVGHLRLWEKRAVAVQLVESRLALYSSDKVDANRLMRCWAAHDLLIVQAGLEGVDVSYRTIRDGWCLLTRRVDKDTPAEHYILLPGVEEEAREFFSLALANSLPHESCVKQCRALAGKARNRPAKQQTAMHACQSAPGEILFPQVAVAPRHVAGFLAQTILENANPSLVLVELLGLLIAADDATFEATVQEAICAAAFTIEEAVREAEQDADLE